MISSVSASDQDQRIRSSETPESRLSRSTPATPRVEESSGAVPVESPRYPEDGGNPE